MIIAKGKQYDSAIQNELLDHLEREINETLTSKTLSMETVIGALDILSHRIAAGEFDERIARLPMEGAEQYKQLAVTLLSRAHVEFKIRTELSENSRLSYVTEPPYDLPKLRVKAMPLGVLLHIAAGNADGLPAYSLAEGMLTGNVNILKLPQADNGLSVEIIMTLIDIEPSLADFIYVFDTPSTDVAAIQRMAELSDGIVVWGGDMAVSAVRKFAPLGARIIEWGHKLSFAYISGYEDKERELNALAEHIMSTKQLLCSSCQTIFIDTEQMEDVYVFCREFLPYLEQAAYAHQSHTIGGVAEITLRKYTERLESIFKKTDGDTNQQFKGTLCSLTPCTDSNLELSGMFGNCLVKRLPEKELLKVLRRKKNYLQTAGLICSVDQREHLTELLLRSGVVRITGAGNMSASFAGEAHDGEYPLQRYLRIVNEEI